MERNSLVDNSLLSEDTRFSVNVSPSLISSASMNSNLLSNNKIEEEPSNKILWLLDNGHGGIIGGKYQTKGKRSPVLEDGRQVFEGVFNRQVVRKIIENCEVNNLRYVNIADTQEDMPLSERVRIANKLCNSYKNCIYISVHANAFGDGKSFNNASGIETFYYQHPKRKSSYSKKGKIIAEAFQDQIVTTIRVRNRGIKGAYFYVLRRVLCPSILTENGFMTNKMEAEMMLQEEYQLKVAEAHINTMVKLEESFMYSD